MAEYSDTHCHLNLNSLNDDLPAVLARARQAGVTRILVPGIDLPTSWEAVQLSAQYPEVFAAVGVHPNSAQVWDSATLAELQRLALQPKVCAIGEIGLDFYRDSAPPALQAEILALQLDLAARLGKPVILHSRESLDALWEILCAWHDRLIEGAWPLARRPGILHSFTGSAAAGLAAFQRGFLLGISGPVTYKNAADRQKTVAELPLQGLLIETDAPYLPPHPHRGKRNEPANVTLVVDKIASLHNCSTTEVQSITNRNADEIFGWRTPA